MNNETARDLIRKLENELREIQRSLFVVSEEIQFGRPSEQDEATYNFLIQLRLEKEAVVRELEPLAYSKEFLEEEREWQREQAREAGMLGGIAAYNDFYGY